MKNIVFYSPDFSLCFSLLMFLQDRYKVTTTSDINILKALVENSNFDLLLLDAEPSKGVEELCKYVNESLKKPILITYVFTKQIAPIDNNLRNYVSSIFYKPFDLNEISIKLKEVLI